MDVKEEIRQYSTKPLTYHFIRSLLKDYKRPNDKINDMVNQGILASLKKGFYIAGPQLKAPKPEPFLIANHLWGPSYVSMDSALSFYGFIPERVFEISSVTTKSSNKYSTSAGTFSYTHLPLPYYSYGIQQINLATREFALIASKEKALCDKIITTAGLKLRSEKNVLDYLIENLRIDEDLLKTLNTDIIEEWIHHAPKESSLKMMIKTIRKL